MTNPLPRPAGTTLDPTAGTGSCTGDPRIVAAIEEYLAAARAGTRPDRSEFLARHAEIAVELADCLDGLDFIREAAGSQDPGGQTDAGPGFEPAASLGDFRIVRELGRGGMGVVYEAEQVSLSRRVALKVLPFASAIDPRRIQRFRVEAQAAAQLHHPHIVPIFAVGCDRGVHYYAMQLIEGRTLAAVVDGPGKPQGVGSDPDGGSALVDDPTTSTTAPVPNTPYLRDLAPSSSSNASGSNTPRSGWARFRAIARLGVQAAEALEHAHGLGIVHRDVKPGNLMVDAEGEVWITDFGLARYREEGGLTRSGDLLGTLRYMSPEQARAGGAIVDQRTDIYSLGATLYELATLRPAFGGRDRQELLRRVTHDDPPAPRRIDPTIPRDLETIIMKAMAKEPASRYSSAQELADDLRRFQEHKPIRARRPTAAEHLAKWARRHRAPVLTTAIALLLASAVAAGLLWNEQRKTARALADLEAIRARERATLPEVLFEVETMSMANMERWSGGEYVPANPEAERFIAMALRNYEGLVLLSHDDHDLRMRLVAAKALFGRAIARKLLGRPGADESLREAVAAYEALLAESPDHPQYAFGLAASLQYLGDWLFQSGGRAAAEPIFTRLLDYERGLVDRHRGSAEFRSYLTSGLIRWGQHLSRAGLHAESGRVFKEAVEASPTDSNAQLLWGEWLTGDGRREEAGRAFKQAVEASPTNSSALLLWGEWLSGGGRREEAVRVWESAVKASPSNSAVLNGVAWYLSIRPDTSPKDAARAIELAEKAIALEPKPPAAFWNTLGVARLRSGRADAAEVLEQSLREGSTGKLALDWFPLAIIYARRGDAEKARKLFDQAVRWSREYATQ
ncbi:MAG TPA: protein kinase, partial [Isosphaeraceae bacterium]